VGENGKAVLFVSPAPVGPQLTGPARRAIKLALAVAEHCPVTLAAPAPSDFRDLPLRTLETRPGNDSRLAGAIAAHEVVVVQTLPSPRQLATARLRARHLVVDMIAPLALEASETGARRGARAAVARWRARELVAHLRAADLVLCSNERQRDFMIGAAVAAGAAGHGGRPLAERILVVPHGIDDQTPRRGGSPLRESGAVAEGDRVAIWAGGMWSWLDPLTAVKALERLRPRRPDLRLAFVGFDHPDPEQRRAHAGVASEALAYARDRGLRDSLVVRPAWLPRPDYFDHLFEADVGVSLHRPTLEGRFATRTRVLDYLHAGLPVVCTEGETMADLVALHGFGQVVPALDVDGCAAALDALTSGSPRRVGEEALEPFRWRTVARPLVELCLDPGPCRPASRREALAMAARHYPAFADAFYRTDPSGAVRALGRRAARLTRRG
jgi:glycosyltransferase involved in cell wall biosynthesis